MTIAADDFAEFFVAANGVRPFSWQVRLLEFIMSEGRWPELIDAPTGSGKTSVIDIHVFANALSAAGTGPRVPRRLAIVVNRRALVDSHADHAAALTRLLSEAAAGPGPILREVSSALRGLSVLECPMRVTSVRGGQPSGRTWIDDPTTTMIVAATPDMWGSRVLFRGYGLSRRARPRDAGLLAVDSVMVLDEAHLNRQLLQTAMDVSTIVGRGAGDLGEVPGLQVVATTATPVAGIAVEAVGVEEADLATDDSLRCRLTHPKRLRVVQTSEGDRTEAARRRYAAMLADEAEYHADNSRGRTVLVVVNRPSTAVEVARVLSRRHPPVTSGDRSVRAVECWVGPLRPMDLEVLRVDKPGLFTVAGDPDTRFLVATQTVEVGVDIDCGGLVTELAPGSGLAQRFGRINRLGRDLETSVTVVVPEDGAGTARSPYLVSDLAAARDWLGTLGSDADVSPWALRGAPPPDEQLRTTVLSDLNSGDLELLSRTTDDLFAEPDLSFWLRDDLTTRPDPVSIVMRDLPEPELAHRARRRSEPTELDAMADEIILPLLRATPPTAYESFPVTIGVGRQVVDRILRGHARTRVYLVREDGPVRISTTDGLRPGDTVVMDPHPIVTVGVVLPEPATSGDTPRCIWGEEGVEVFLPGSAGPGELDLCAALSGLSPEDAQEAFLRLTGDRGQVILPPDGVRTVTGDLPWIVQKPSATVLEDDDTRQEWTSRDTTREPVFLDCHQAAVASRVEEMAAHIGLPPDVKHALRQAGAHHDDGKADPMFQTLLQETSAADLSAVKDRVLAKSLGRSAQGVRRRSAARPGWRHEQLSAVHAFIALADDPTQDLVARLTGTSHGYGRPFFPRGAGRLLDEHYEGPVADVAREMFATGAGWSDILDTTERRFGLWGVAYLEAVLRAADCAVSKEGS